MDVHIDSIFGTMAAVDDFSIEVADDRDGTYDTLLYKGRRVTEVEARVMEAQFRLPDGSTLLMLNDDTPFRERLTILLVSSGLRVLDRILVGGAFTPGYLTYAYPSGPDEVAFCWHDLDQIVTIRRHARRFGLGSGWLMARDVPAVLPNSPRAPMPRLGRWMLPFALLTGMRWNRRLRRR